jgi:cell division protein FtsI/penicillin-binding protein 2
MNWRIDSPYYPVPRLYRRRPRSRHRPLLLALLAMASGVLLLFFLVGHPATGPGPARAGNSAQAQEDEARVQEPPQKLSQERLARMMGRRAIGPEEARFLRVVDDKTGRPYFVQTSLDPDLQEWALETLSHVNAHAAAVVVMNPTDGRILAMAGHEEGRTTANMALASAFPAASVFKIVTAAAAMETTRMTGSTSLAYDGRPHTLYKQHLRSGLFSGRNLVSLKESFAKSINVVFGKLGAHALGPRVLEEFARRFYFNRPIRFEMPVEPSDFFLPAKDIYSLAELASGYNRTTLLSPLHGALLAAIVANDGVLMEPSVVREVYDDDHAVCYRHVPAALGRVVSSRTAGEMKDLMEATVSEGTARNTFRDRLRHPVLSRLCLGGKSGSINDDAGRRVDWFVAFAEPEGSSDRLVVAAVVVHHQRTLGLRALKIVREGVIHYYEPRLSNAVASRGKGR